MTRWFFLFLEADSFEGVTGLLGPPLLQDHQADITPVTMFAAAMDNGRRVSRPVTRTATDFTFTALPSV